MAFPNYGYGNYGYGTAPGYAGEDAFSAGSYNPRYHYAAAQQHGFELGTEDGMPRTVYVGNLDPSVTEEFITTLFGQIGTVSKTKVIFDAASDPYAFVEFADHYTATQALTAMNKRMLLDREMKVNWATQPGTQQKVDTSKHFHVFVGDLSPEVDNKQLKDAFTPFGEVSDAKVIRDPQTLKSKGYGFCSFPKREEAERAIEQMNGQWLGRRTIRTNWATRKPNAMGSLEPYGGPHAHSVKSSFDEVAAMTGSENSSVYVGSLSVQASDDDIRKAFARFGTIQDIRHFKAQGYAFVRFDKKESATNAIVEMNGTELLGQTVRCSWGKTDYTLKGATAPGARPTAPYGVNPMTGAFAATGAPGAAGAAGAASAESMQQYWNYYQQYQQYYNNQQY